MSDKNKDLIQVSQFSESKAALVQSGYVYAPIPMREEVEQFGEHDQVHFNSSSLHPHLAKLVSQHGGSISRGPMGKDTFSLPRAKTEAFHAAAKVAGFNANQHYKFKSNSSSSVGAMNLHD